MNDQRSARDVLIHPVGHPLREFEEIDAANSKAAHAAAYAKLFPSPRETLRAVVEELKKRLDGADRYAGLSPERIVFCRGQATAYVDAIALIRSMAGHLMEDHNES